MTRIWTEAEYLALGVTEVRDELIDGKIAISPFPCNAHQAIGVDTTELLEARGRPADRP
jgi:hypothetical protein